MGIGIRADLIDFYIDAYYSGQKNKTGLSHLSYLNFGAFYPTSSIIIFRSTFKCKKIVSKISVFQGNLLFSAIIASNSLLCVESQAFSWLADAGGRKAQESRMRARDAGRKTSTAVTADELF
jgi:hypothetical protein